MSNTENVLRIVSAVADRHKVILYKEDGDTVIINQGDHRLKALIDEIMPITAKGEVAVVSLEKFSVYADFEKNTGGLVKMFRVARNKLKSWLGVESTTEIVIVNSPSAGSPEAAPVQPVLEALQDSLKPVGLDDTVTEAETIVAVVNKKVIPDVHKMKHLLHSANKNASTKAIENLLTRLSAIIDNRQHSVEDLMRFLEKADLPIAEDGSIIAYKILKRKKGKYVDCHTARVVQQVGSYVCVNENLVDLNRRNECSNGLHIARRGYIGQFSGDVCVLCKIDPEDVMVVPHNDANKIRVKGYHILAELSDEAYAYLKANRPMTTEMEALKIVYAAIKGNHISRIERVEIKGQSGTNVVTTPLNTNDSRPPKVKAGREDLTKAVAVDDEITPAPAVEPREINKRLAEMDQAKQSDKEKPLTKAEQARKLYNEWKKNSNQENLNALMLFKKKAKKGWGVLGFSDKEIKAIEKALK